MSDIVVIGGGVTGLAAAFELEQRGVPYTLIEVKGRLGGSVITERRGDFVLDGGPFALHKTRDWPVLAELGLQDALFTLDMPASPGAEYVAFKTGTQTLTDALAARLTHGRLIRRMAVSSIGVFDGQYAICMENGMVFNAAALVICAPARYAERMFYGFRPGISQQLLQFRYDTITRVSLVYPLGDIDLPILAPPDPGYAFGHWTTSPHRVTPGHVLVQVGVRYPLGDTPPADLVSELQANMGWPSTAVAAYVQYWPESHTLARHDAAHNTIMDAIENDLPPGIALAGSDYRARYFEDRLEQGRAAASAVLG